MRISPINVSVHTMDPELRCKMMGNRFAGDSLRHLYRLAEGGIRLNCQIVLCPGLNDGAALEFTLEKLFSLGEGLLSVALCARGPHPLPGGPVPPHPLRPGGGPAGRGPAGALGGEIPPGAGQPHGLRLRRALPPGRAAIPPLEFYEDFPQIENGVGMLRNLEDELTWALQDLDLPDITRKVTIPTGRGAMLSSRRCLTDAAGNAII